MRGVQIPQNTNLPPNAAGTDAVMKLLTVDIITAPDPLMRHVARAKKVSCFTLAYGEPCSASCSHSLGAMFYI